jgi:hypothetical protein
MKKIVITEEEKKNILNQHKIIKESKSDLTNLSNTTLEKKLNLPKECKVEIKKGDASSDKYGNYVKYIITQLPFPVDEHREKLMKKIKSFNSEGIYSSVKPNFGKGITWTIKY